MPRSADWVPYRGRKSRFGLKWKYLKKRCLCSTKRKSKVPSLDPKRTIILTTILLKGKNNNSDRGRTAWIDDAIRWIMVISEDDARRVTKQCKNSYVVKDPHQLTTSAKGSVPQGGRPYILRGCGVGLCDARKRVVAVPSRWCTRHDGDARIIQRLPRLLND